MKTLQNIAKALVSSAILTSTETNAQPWGNSLAGVSISHEVVTGLFPYFGSGTYVYLFNEAGTNAWFWTPTYIYSDPRITKNDINYVGLGTWPDGGFWAQNHRADTADSFSSYNYSWNIAGETAGSYERDQWFYGNNGPTLGNASEEGYFQCTASTAPTNLTKLTITLTSNGSNVCQLTFNSTWEGNDERGWTTSAGSYTVSNIVHQTTITGGTYQIERPNHSTTLLYLTDKNGAKITTALLWTSTNNFSYVGSNTAFDGGHVATLSDRPSPTITMVKSGKNLIVSWPSGVLYQADKVTGPFTKVNASSPYTVDPTKAPMKFYLLRAQ